MAMGLRLVFNKCVTRMLSFDNARAAKRQTFQGIDAVLLSNACNLVTDACFRETNFAQ